MNRTERIVTIVLVLAGAVPAISSALVAHDGADAKLTALVAAYAKNTEGTPATWPDLSSNGLHNLMTQDQLVLGQLHGIPRSKLSPENRELHDLLEWQIDSRIDQMRARLYLTPFWEDRRLLSSGGLLHAIDPLWTLPKPATLSEYQERIRKLQAFPQYAEQVVALLREAKESRMLAARQLAWQSLTFTRRWLNSQPGAVRDYFAPKTNITEAERTLYAPFESMDGISPTESLQLQQMARTTIRERVLPALGAYYDVLSQEYLPACPEWFSLSRWDNGADVYRVLLRLSTTTELDPKQVQSLGLQEVKRIRREMASLVPRIGFKGSLDEFLLHVTKGREFYFGGDEQLLLAYRAAIEQIQPLLPRVVSNVPTINIRVQGVHGGGAASYEAPNASHSYDLVNVEIGTPSIHPKFEVIPLMLHEGLPGHALQFEAAREFESKNPDSVTNFKEQARQSDGFREGWGLYSESLGRDLGMYRTPLDEFGALRMELTRAVRIVVDTGIHLSGWTLQEAEDYEATTTGEPGAEIDLDVGRSSWPGVIPSYTVGAHQIFVMRDMTAKRLGARFDLRRFDDVLLLWGPLPLEVMQHKLTDCLDDERCSYSFEASTR